MILATHGIVGSQIAQFVGLLDLYPNAAVAYSLRKLRTAYTGSAIRVRRASDNTEQDMGFANNVLDTSSLTSFCSGTNGFVTTWYDQSGNGRNATQTTAANQPQIVSSGSVITENGKPSLQFDGNDDYFILNNIVPNSEWSIFGIGARKSTNKIMSFFGNVSSIASALVQYFDSITYLLGSGQYRNTTATNTNLTMTLWSGFVSSNLPQSIYKNNIVQSSSTTNTTVSQGFSRIGNYSSFYSQAQISETILYQSDQSSNRTGIETNINDFYSIY
jgi:hypothetical protein